MIICCAGIMPNLCRFCSKFILRQFFCDAFISMSIFDKFLAVKMNKKQDWKKKQLGYKSDENVQDDSVQWSNQPIWIKCLQENLCFFFSSAKFGNNKIEMEYVHHSNIHLQIDFHHQFFIVCDIVSVSVCLCLSLSLCVCFAYLWSTLISDNLLTI